MSNYDKQEWQAQQAVQDVALEKQRAREAKARERSARNAQRKLERLQAKLKDIGELTEWEDDFAGSVQERLDTFGSAFADRSKGRPGDALSFAQKRVVASLNKKVKDARKAAQKIVKGGVETESRHTNSDTDNAPLYKPRSSFKPKGPKFTPRVRHIEDDFAEDSRREGKPERSVPVLARSSTDEPLLARSPRDEALLARPPVGKPFLRIVKN